MIQIIQSISAFQILVYCKLQKNKTKKMGLILKRLVLIICFLFNLHKFIKTFC